MQFKSRAVRLIATLAAVLVPLALSNSATAAEWPERPITIVIGFGVGGSADRTTRAVASFLPEEIGQPILTVNRQGAGGQLAASYVLGAPDDGYTLLGTALSPYLGTSILVGGAQYEMEDFAFINAQWTDWDLIAVNKDSPFKTLPELIKAIEAEPKKHSVSLVFGSSGHLTTLLLLDEFGIPRENLNLVNYDSGAAARSAVAGGQVTFTILGAEGSEGVRDFIRPLAVVREDANEMWDAPPINEALAPTGVRIPVVLGSMRGLVAPATFKQKHPERFDKLVAAYKAVLDRKDVQKYLARSGVGGEWLGPEKTTKQVMEMYAVFEKYKDLLKQ